MFTVVWEQANNLSVPDFFFPQMRFTADLHLDPLNGNNLLCWIPTNDTLKIRFFLKLLPFSCVYLNCSLVQSVKSVNVFSFAATIRISTYM